MPTRGTENWTLIPDDLARAVRAVRLNLSEAARRYGCTRWFVKAVVDGRSPCPARMRELLQTMVRERLAELPATYRKGTR